jgi:Predicted Zn-dependent hydrolases of the beta-lactamase fold
MNEPREVAAKCAVPIGREAFEPIDHTTVHWLGGAGFLVNARGRIFLIDPVLMTSEDDESISEFGLKLKIRFPLSPEGIPRLDAVFYTHRDADHMGPRTAVALAALKPAFVGTLSVFERLVRLGIPHELIVVCREGDPVVVSGTQVDVTPADHPWQLIAPERAGKPFRAGDCCGFVLDTPDGRLFFPGDTRLMEEHLRIADIQLLALDVSICPYHLGHAAAVLLANSMPNALILPMHYGTYDAPDKGAHLGDPADVFPHIHGADERAKILAPGECVRLRDGRETA